MLVLSRGPQDKVLFPRLGICVEVLRIANKQVRLGITAPKDVKIAREEGYAAQFEQTLPLSDAELPASARERMSAANKLVQEAAKHLASSNSAEAMRLLNLALSEFDLLENSESDSQDLVQESKASYGHAKQILVVDENERSSQLLSGVLRLKGFDVVEANDALRVLYRLAGYVPVDAVVMDTAIHPDNSALMLQQVSIAAKSSRPRVFAIGALQDADFGADAGYGRLDPKLFEHCFEKSTNPLEIADQLVAFLAD